MQTSRVRMNEGRGSRKLMLVAALLVVGIVVGGIIAFGGGNLGFTQAQVSPDETNVSKSAQPSVAKRAGPGSAVESNSQGNTSPVTSKVKVTDGAGPGNAGPEGAAQEAGATGEELTKVKVLPDAKFGELLDEGWVTLGLPAGQTAETWYTLQVDTQTKEITKFFALYNSDSDMVSAVKIENYVKGEPIDNARIEFFYEEGPSRVTFFDGNDGTMTLSQELPQPYGPTMFSSDLRVALVSYGLELKDSTGATNALINLDPTGLSSGEVIILKQPSPRIVGDMLREIEAIATQIELMRAN